MKKLIAIILLICMLTSLAACKKDKDGEKPSEDTEDTSPDKNEQDPEDTSPTIVVPEYKDYGRGTVDFGSIIYTRPNIEAVIDSFEASTQSVTRNDKSVAEQIADLGALESPLSNVKTMCSMIEINRSKNSSIQFWIEEAAYVGEYYPLLTQAVENLLVACARSVNKTAFESDYFGYDLDEYENGGIYTDAVVSLMQRESELEDEYSSFSTATVEISYTRFGVAEPFKGTVDEVKAQLKQYFGNDTAAYSNALINVNNLYKQKLNELSKPIFIELIKVRRLIADELGYGSYTELAYENLGYDYSSEDMLALLGDVGNYVFTITDALTTEVFERYDPPKTSVDTVTLINTLYTVYSDLGGTYKDAFSYMLQHGLYDISGKAENRYYGAFSTYLESNASPYIFITTSGNMSDYTVTAHEFGHFLDGYVNFGKEDSLSIMEVSSETMELLTLLRLKGILHNTEYKYLTYVTISNYLYEVLLAQSFYSAFEHMIYALDYNEITEDKLVAIMKEAHTFIYGESSVDLKLSDVIIPHTTLYPCYVESYVTSALVSLDIFFMENESRDSGFALYEALINRTDKDLSFTERLEKTGIDSPFSNGKVEEISSEIYRYITGKDYSFSGSSENAA